MDPQIVKQSRGVAPGEIVYRWEELNEGQQHTVALVHATLLKSTNEKVLRLFNLGHPMIIFAPDHSYCRIHHDSVGVMKVIITNYL